MREDYLPFGRPSFSDEEIAAVTRVMRSGWVGMGGETIAFEEELAEYVGAPHVVTVNSCTAAMFLALLVQGIGADDEVICPSLTWCSTANVALYVGARPVFCDVDPATYCLTPELVKAKLSPRTRAVMAVHFGGLAVDVKALRAALPDRVKVIEDAAHAFGTRFADGSAVGSSTCHTCFSFYANKNLSTAEGGAIALYDARQADRIRSLRQHGLAVDAWQRFVNGRALLVSPFLSELGYKMNYTDLQASIGRVQLRRQADFARQRRLIAQRYCQALPAVSPSLRVQRGVTDEEHSRHLFVVELPLDELRLSRNDFVLELHACNIGASIHYAPLHLMPLYGAESIRLPETERICQRVLTLPISASMTLADADDVISQFAAIFTKWRAA
jgi:perosamine synthetase